MKKKQELAYQGTLKTGQEIVTGNLVYLAYESTTEIKALNRKSRRAFQKIINKELKKA
jgi:hypothetical protein